MSLFYREIESSAKFSHLVLSFWEFKTANENFDSIKHEVFPDGCVSLFYHRNENLNFSRIALSGLYLETLIVPVIPNDVFWAMRFSPAVCAGVLRQNPANFRNIRMSEAENFPHLTEGLLEKLDICENFDEAIDTYENHLKKLNFGHSVSDEKIAQAVKIIEETGGEIKIAALAEKLNLSPRQFERRFKRSSGLSPKQFARTRRIRAAAIGLVENDRLNWANRAAKMGFADQSHLVHEFVSVTKRSPNSFAEKLKQIEHGNIIK